MKITNVNKPIVNFEKTTILMPQEGTGPVPFTIKIALLNCLGSKKPKNGKEAIEIFILGCKISEIDGDSEAKIDANEFLLLKTSVEENIPQYTAIILGQLMLFIEDIEKL